MSNITEALQLVERSLNVMSGGRKNEEDVVIFFRAMHRTLQQQFVARVIIPILRHLAEAHRNGYTDARNQQAAALASKMLDAVRESDLYLPLI